MGGRGSGTRQGERRKRTTEDLRSLDVRDLKRERLIAEGQERFVLRPGVELRLTWTPSGFAGDSPGCYMRPFFVCPGSRCGNRRAAILYLDGPRLLCRICCDLAYPSQRESPLGRARRRAQKARSKLGPDSAPRPKGMHHRTFLRLAHKYLAAAEEQRTLYNEWGARLSGRTRRSGGK